MQSWVLLKPCESGLARDSGVSVDIISGCAGIIASKPGSHRGIEVCSEYKKPLNREIQGLCFNRITDQAASILLRFCSTLFR